MRAAHICCELASLGPPASLSSGVGCDSRMARKYKILLILGALACTAFALYLPTFIHNRNTAASRAAIHNLEEIDKASRQMSAEPSGATNGGPSATNQTPITR